MSFIFPFTKLGQYFKNKTVLPKWNFLVLFEFTSSVTKSLGMPDVLPMHVVDVSIPQYKAKPITTMYGAVPWTFPVLDHQGFEIKVTFEDDR